MGKYHLELSKMPFTCGIYRSLKLDISSLNSQDDLFFMEKVTEILVILAKKIIQVKQTNGTIESCCVTIGSPIDSHNRKDIYKSHRDLLSNKIKLRMSFNVSDKILTTLAILLEKLK